MKAMYKSELAKAAGVSERSFRRWLKDPEIMTQLEPFKLKKQQRQLPPKAVKIITDYYAIEID